MTWTLDYARASDLDDAVGFWRVPVLDAPDESLVVYALDVRLKGAIAALFEGVFVERSLREATRWLKAQAERRYTAAARL
ncbi:MAG: hypothetical protein GWN84_02900 [Gammaproteobacteria bacterium]|nr:hypothetical protein [Gammaproteobacteria bacterium]NIR82096.1 hypothetical protein [Gammaproteobacteria bacterium]NIR89329.1 hypothetical protein [Gammaproteobacteria bacterium]NIU03206.1 hypothetical protein [Gammaproteobacteria bacterium]NIV74501.1 hypothetical protein [Gammaproteobacteria bacterium]